MWKRSLRAYVVVAAIAVAIQTFGTGCGSSTSPTAGTSGTERKANTTAKKSPGDSITLRMDIYRFPKGKQPPVITKKVVVPILTSREVAEEQGWAVTKHPRHSVFAIELRFESMQLESLSTEQEKQ